MSQRKFPITKVELDAIRAGIRRDAVVPVARRSFFSRRGETLSPGDTVVFAEAIRDLFGVPRFLPFGESVSVKLIQVRDENYRWCGQSLTYIAWEPRDVEELDDDEPDGLSASPDHRAERWDEP